VAAARALAERGYGQSRCRIGERSRRTSTPARAAVWRRLSDIRPESVRWLWRGRLALGTLTLWIGDGGLGKSRASNDVAARVTVGELWPDGGSAAAGNVIVLSAEDSPSYTIRPAIEAAGGDLAKVFILDAVADVDGHERTFNLSTDLIALENLLHISEARLVIIDPVSAYFGTTLDSYRDSDVRSVLEPLVKMSERRGVAVLGIMHIGKSADRQARHRALGSVAFVNAARLVFAVGPDPQDATKRLLVPVKVNLCREASPLAFRLEDSDGIARVVWETDPVPEISADAVLNSRPLAEDDERQTAEDLLRQLLDDEAWPMAAKAVEQAGRAHGIHVRSLQRAARRLGVSIRKSSFKSGWLWFRPAAGEQGTSSPVSSGTEGDTTTVVSSSASASNLEATKTTPSPTRHEDGSVPVRSSSGDLSSSIQPNTTPSSSSSSEEIQQNTRMGEDDSSVSRQICEMLSADDDLPTCLRELIDPDYSDPIGEHDEPMSDPIG
jgi:putative DNA primase/helicase